MAYIMKYNDSQFPGVAQKIHMRAAICIITRTPSGKFCIFAGEKEKKMKDINLEESKIQIEGRWYSAEDLAGEIQNKIQSGDMKIATYASALERLTVAVENSHVMDVKIVLTKEEYQLLKKIGKGDDAECVRKAILALVNRKKTAEKLSLEEKYRTGTDADADDKSEPDKVIGKCIKCNASTRIPKGTHPGSVLCSACMDTEKKDLSDSQIKFKDHFLG